jgi:methyltransferase (TIGR00027 family)
LALRQFAAVNNNLMASSESQITHVSDTALLVAAARAAESATEDAFMHDPFAARLAGDRGIAIATALPYREMLRFGVAVRTRFLDELLTGLLATQSIATVLSIGCGLDARPWRLDLPPQLRWIEVDFADMLEYKESVLAGETPRCRRERLTADLNDPAQRHAIYAAAGSDPALMITEGLLMYLPGSTVEALAAEAMQHPNITHWMADITTAAFSRALSPRASSAMQSVEHVQATDRLEGEQMLELIQRHGWSIGARRSYITDIGFAAARVQRMMALRSDATPPQFPPGDLTGVLRFSR